MSTPTYNYSKRNTRSTRSRSTPSPDQSNTAGSRNTSVSAADRRTELIDKLNRMLDSYDDKYQEKIDAIKRKTVKTLDDGDEVSDRDKTFNVM